MNLQQKMPTTADEFLAWNEGREGKREFVRGRVVEMMINVTRRHAVLAARLTSILLKQLPYPDFSVGSADFGVRTPEGIRYPDVFVDKGTDTSRDNDLVAVEPILLGEVLSSSSYARDLVEKLTDYRRIDSLQVYLVVSQEEPRTWLWTRDGDGQWRKMHEIVGTEEVVRLEAPGVSIDMSELYSGFER